MFSILPSYMYANNCDEVLRMRLEQAKAYDSGRFSEAKELGIQIKIKMKDIENYETSNGIEGKFAKLLGDK